MAVFGADLFSRHNADDGIALFKSSCNRTDNKSSIAFFASLKPELNLGFQRVI
jgi:hypothetical protein